MPAFNPNANPSIFNLDMPSGLPPASGIQGGGTSIGTYGAPITNPAALGFLARQGAAGMSTADLTNWYGNALSKGQGGVYKGPTGNRTNYFLNGMPISGADLPGALSSIQQGSGTSGGPGLAGVPQNTGGLPNYNSLMQWLQNLNSPGQAYETPDASPRGPTWT